MAAVHTLPAANNDRRNEDGRMETHMTLEKFKRIGIVCGTSQVMERLYEQVERVAATEATVLLLGESGTGKEVLANAIHQASQRKEQPFVAVNCGAIPPHLIEAALFGHEKGSFTGASRQHMGYFEQASGGTLFLDEITEMPIDMQVKLLRVLESGSFLRVGGDQEVKVDVRMIAATNRDLDAAVKQGNLREDLMYRLAVFPIRIAPLRERGSDIELLAHHFLHDLNEKENATKNFSRASLDVIRSYSWPGNVRELKNVVQRAYILATDTLNIEECISDLSSKKPTVHEGYLNFFVGTPLADAQKEIILATLKHYSGNKRLTAEALGISLKTLYNRLKEY
jgi:DNA-binding NtrC family response regulator